MSKINTVDMDVMSEIASAIVERQFYSDNANNSEEHTVIQDNGDYRYIESVQYEFLSVLDIMDSILNPAV